MVVVIIRIIIFNCGAASFVCQAFVSSGGGLSLSFVVVIVASGARL